MNLSSISSSCQQDIIQNPFPNGQKVNPFGEEKERLNEYALALTEKTINSIKNGSATNQLYEFLDNPNQQLIVVSGFSLNTCLFPYLSECACTTSGKFNRYSNTRRADIENLFLAETTSNFQKEQPFRYLSVGAGGCLQDFINLGKLIKAGFQNIEAVLVDTDFHSKYDTDFYKLNPQCIQQHEFNNNNIIKQMSFLFVVAKELNIKFELSFIDNVSKANGLFNVVQLIDFDGFDDSFRDIMFSHTLLVPNGRYFLSFDDYDLVFDTTKCIHKKIHLSLHDESKKEIKDLLEALNIKDLQKPHVAMLTPKKRRVQWLQILPILCQSDTVKELALTIFQPKKLNSFGCPEKEDNHEFTKDNLSHFFTLLANKTVKVNFCNTEEEFFTGLLNKPDIVTYLFDIGQEIDIDKQITRIRNSYATSKLFFSLSSYNNQEICVMDCSWSWNGNSSSTIYGHPSNLSCQKIEQLMIGNIC